MNHLWPVRRYEPARGGLRRLGRVLLEPGDGLVEYRVRAQRLVEFREEGVGRFRLAGQGAQRVEGGDVA